MLSICLLYRRAVPCRRSFLNWSWRLSCLDHVNPCVSSYSQNIRPRKIEISNMKSCLVNHQCWEGGRCPWGMPCWPTLHSITNLYIWLWLLSRSLRGWDCFLNASTFSGECFILFPTFHLQFSQTNMCFLGGTLSVVPLARALFLPFWMGVSHLDFDKFLILLRHFPLLFGL